MLKETKELIAILSNQKGSVIPEWLVKGAAAQLDSSQPNTSKAESIITQLKKGEMHPALGDKIRKAEKKLTESKLKMVGIKFAGKYLVNQIALCQF